MKWPQRNQISPLIKNAKWRNSLLSIRNKLEQAQFVFRLGCQFRNPILTPLGYTAFTCKELYYKRVGSLGNAFFAASDISWTSFSQCRERLWERGCNFSRIILTPQDNLLWKLCLRLIDFCRGWLRKLQFKPHCIEGDDCACAQCFRKTELWGSCFTIDQQDTQAGCHRLDLLLRYCFPIRIVVLQAQAGVFLLFCLFEAEISLWLF